MPLAVEELNIWNASETEEEGGIGHGLTHAAARFRMYYLQVASNRRAHIVISVFLPGIG